MSPELIQNVVTIVISAAGTGGIVGLIVGERIAKLQATIERNRREDDTAIRKWVEENFQRIGRPRQL